MTRRLASVAMTALLLPGASGWTAHRPSQPGALPLFREGEPRARNCCSIGFNVVQPTKGESKMRTIYEPRVGYCFTLADGTQMRGDSRVAKDRWRMLREGRLCR